MWLEAKILHYLYGSDFNRCGVVLGDVVKRLESAPSVKLIFERGFMESKNAKRQPYRGRKFV